MATRELIHVIGVVSQAPQRRNGDVVAMSVAQQIRYGSRANGVAPESRFLDVAIFDEQLGNAVMQELYKGAKVAIEGTYAQNEYNGQIRHSLYAYKVYPLETILTTAPKDAAKKQPVAAGAAEW